jgi:hypothetical protein
MHTAILVICIVAPWVGKRLDEVRHQEQAVAAIVKVGGRVIYDYQRPLADYPTLFQPTWRSPYPPAAVRLLGRDFFHRVVHVDLSETSVTNEDLVAVGRLRSLESLFLNGTGVTAVGLANLEVLKNLRILNLRDTAINDVAMVHLRAFTHLRQLDLGGTRISDEGLVHLEPLTELEDGLTLDRTAITNLGLEQLVHLKKLRQLHLEDTGVTPEGVAILQTALPATKIVSQSAAVAGRGFF